jgi:RimJ/RimL family protein N-acetyltransferase
MQHDLVLDGRVFRLRPVTLADAAFIADLRSARGERLKYVHKVAKDPAAQEAWLKSYFDRQGDYYWIVERKANSLPEGMISLYDLNETSRTAEWGRWVLRDGSLAAVDSAMLVYSAAFDILKLHSIYSLTVVANAAVVSFHDSSGATREEVLQDHFTLEGDRCDAVRHRVTRQTYPQVKERLVRASAMIASKLQS